MKNNAFTLVEILVVIAVLSIAGLLVLYIFANVLRGSNKAQILSSIKKNGQATLEIIDKTVRGADNVVCITPSQDTLVVSKEGTYTRFRHIPPQNSNLSYGDCKSKNGCLLRDFPKQPLPPAPKSIIQTFLNNVCTDPMGTDSSIPVQVLTDKDEQTGVSIERSQAGVFTKNTQAGFKDTVNISFKAQSPVGAPSSISGQIDSVEFVTTVELR